MKSVIHPCRILAVYLLATAVLSTYAQQPITGILTNNITSSQVSYTNIKGAGLRNILSPFSLISSWDSSLTSYTVNYSVPAAANILRLSQFSVGSFSSNLITLPVTSSYVKIRRATNPDVGDARNYYNFWAKYSSSPNPLALNGTFNFTAPEVLNPEDAFMSNNLTSGYDNIFQNTIANPHFGNIERIDYIVPGGLYCHNNTDRLESGVAVIDRGTGDPFKIAAITGIDATGLPTSFGTLVSVTAANFGGNLLAASFDYGIMINDSKFQSQSRPSTRSSQNLRGVYISLANMGIAVGQRFYGYALFGPNVVTADPDWTTYPNNTSSGSQLDPVNLVGFYKTPGSVLPIDINFTASRNEQTAKLQVELFNPFDGDAIIIQQSIDGSNFTDIGTLKTSGTGIYNYTDAQPAAGVNYYRLKMIEQNGSINFSGIRAVKFDEKENITVFPNPAIDNISIQIPSSWNQQAITVEILSTTGHLVKRNTYLAASTRQAIDVQELPKGGYLLKLIRKDGVAVVKQFTLL